MSREDFISQVGTIISSEAFSRGYKFPSAIIAQACIESAFGESFLLSYFFVSEDIFFQRFVYCLYWLSF